MENGEKNGSWYLYVNGEKVTVSHEVYRMIRQENNSVHYQARTEFRCAQENYAHCWGDCQSCPWYTNGRMESFSLMLEDRANELVSSQDVESEVLSRLTMEKVYAVAGTVVPQGGLILRLRFEEELSNREIADKLGICHGTIDYRLKKLIRYFRENAKKYF